MAFDKSPTEVLRATEPSVVMGHDNKSLFKLCNEANSKNNLTGVGNHKLDTSSNSCVMLWAESLGTRSSMGKLLLHWEGK